MQNPTANGANQQEQHLRDRLELLQESNRPSSEHSPDTPQQQDQHQHQQRQQSGHSAASDHSPPQHGYEQLSVESQEAINALAAKGQAESFIHPDLRHSPEQKDDDTMMSMTALPPQNHHHNPGQLGPPAPVLAPAPVGQPGLSEQQHAQHAQHGDEAARQGAKGKRELSSSKRAAQNRAAQRAFRQRKEGYIKTLEQQVSDAREMEKNYKILQEEAYQLREYIIHLQSKLLDTQGDFPQPPPNLSIHGPQHDQALAEGAPQQSTPAPVSGHPPASTEPENTTPLAAVAQAVAGLAAQEMAAGANDARYPSPGPGEYTSEASGQEDLRSADDMHHLSAAASSDVNHGAEQSQASA